MKALRILLLAHNVEDSGTYNRFQGFARHLSAQGHIVTLVAASAKRQLGLQTKDVNGVRLILTPTWLNPRISNGGLGPEDLLARLPLVFEHPYDIIHSSEHRPAASIPAMLLRQFRKTVFISDWADLWGYEGIMEERRPPIRALLGGIETASERGLHRFADAVTTICSDLYERGRGLGIKAERILNLPNGVEINENHPIADRVEGRRKLGLPESGKFLVYAGEAPIDVDLVWSSFREVARRYPEVHLIVLGRKWQIPDIGPASERIIQLGKLPWDRYYLALASADILLLPCRNTARNRARWPGKLGYYMGAGRPIVANPTGEIHTLMTQHQMGILTSEEPAKFAEGIGELLDNPTLADELGKNARVVAETLYAWPIIASRLSAFYEKILAAV